MRDEIRSDGAFQVFLVLLCSTFARGGYGKDAKLDLSSVQRIFVCGVLPWTPI